MVSVDVGHRVAADLRKLSEQVGLKDQYDRYYGWASSFVHGQWGPIRESVFRTCLNPLHRGHRCPYENDPEQLPTVGRDIEHLLNEILSEVDRGYPSFPHRVSRETIERTSRVCCKSRRATRWTLSETTTGSGMQRKAKSRDYLRTFSPWQMLGKLPTPIS